MDSGCPLPVTNGSGAVRVYARGALGRLQTGADAGQGDIGQVAVGGERVDQHAVGHGRGEPGHGRPERAAQAYADAVHRVEAMATTLLEPAVPLVARHDETAPEPEIHRQRTPEQFQEAVAKAIEEIRAGEAFQIVPSQRFELACPADALDVYRVLRRRNPSPYPVSYTHLTLPTSDLV